MKNTVFLAQNLSKSDELEKNIKIICSFNGFKCNIKQGRILNIRNTNICFIEPHKITLTYKYTKLILIYFNKNNLFLYNKTMPLDMKKLDSLLKLVKGSLN